MSNSVPVRNLFATKTALLAYFNCIVALVAPAIPVVGPWVTAHMALIEGIGISVLMLVVRKVTKGRVELVG